MKPRLFVIGARGFVGGHLISAVDPRFERIAAGRFDIADQAAVEQAFEAAEPQIVALLAAMANIDACEHDPVAAYRTNVTGARNVARACARHGARLIFTSSGAVFDGTRAEYREDSQPNPVSVYGLTKAEAEGIVATLVPDAIIVRLSLVLGLPLRDGTNALTERLRAAFEKGKPTAAPPDEYRNAIDVQTAARWMLDLAAAPEARGVFHLGSSDAMPRYEIVRALAQAMGYPANLVTVDQESHPGRAPRGRLHCLVPERIRQFSDTAVPTCREAIERCVHALA